MDETQVTQESESVSPCQKALARFCWADRQAFASHGVRLGLRVNDAAQQQKPCWQDRLRERLPPQWQTTEEADLWYSLAAVSSRAGHRYFLYRETCRIAQSRDFGTMLEVLESDWHTQIAAQTRERLFVHAGVAAWNGKAIVIPGRSFSGKTTLTAALVRAGASYFSDEYAVFDAHGLVYPYSKTLSLRDAEGNPAGRHSVESLGGISSVEPLPVGLVLSCRYEEGAYWRPRTLSPGRALMTLLDNTVQVRPQPQRVLETLHRVVTGARAFQSKRGEAAQVTAWLKSSAFAALAVFVLLSGQAARAGITFFDPLQDTIAALGTETVTTAPYASHVTSPFSVSAGANRLTFTALASNSLQDNVPGAASFAADANPPVNSLRTFDIDSDTVIETADVAEYQPTGPLQITFGQGVTGFGLNAEDYEFVHETFTVTAYDDGRLLGAMTTPLLDSSGPNPGQSAFLGAQTTNGDMITEVTISSTATLPNPMTALETDTGDGNHFVFGPVSLPAAPVPEASTGIACGFGLLLLAGLLRKGIQKV